MYIKIFQKVSCETLEIASVLSSSEICRQISQQLPCGVGPETSKWEGIVRTPGTSGLWKVLEGASVVTKALGGFDCISEIPKSKWDLDAFGPKAQGHVENCAGFRVFVNSLVYAEDVSDSGAISVQSSLQRDDCVHLL